jgi:cytochrome b subunit of formate dehydrogenase
LSTLSRSRVVLALVAQILLLWPAASAWAQQTPYTYIRASLQVPWALYFFFLILIFLPFIFMILLAWRGAAREEENRARIAAEEIAKP